jgi:hypothetical protein
MPLIYNLSDHAPILLSTNGKANNIKSHFKFENWWLKEEDFQNYAKNAWQQSSGKPYQCRTNKLANSLKIWCKKKKPLQEELKELEQDILKSQTAPLSQQDFSKEQQLTTRYEQTLTKLNVSMFRELRRAGQKMETEILLSSIEQLQEEEEGIQSCP